MTMKLLDLYRSLLLTGGLVSSEDGYVSVHMPGGEKTPAVLKGKRLVLPTTEHLRKPMGEERIAFHPLSENILRGESEVLGYLRQAINMRLNLVFGSLALELMQIATSPAEHAKLNPDQSEFLSRVKNADEKTYAVLGKLMQAMPIAQTQKAFVSIYLKRSGTVEGKRYARVGVVSFPLYQELLKAETTHEVYGVKMRVKDRETLLALLEYMVPSIADAQAHHQGSDSKVAPYLDALMKALMVAAGPLNDLIALFRNQLANPEDLQFEDQWVEAFENLEAMIPQIRAIPMQAGNEGSSSGAEGTSGSAAPAAQAAPQQPVFAATAAAQQPAQSVYQQPAYQGQPMYQQPAPVQQPAGPVKTANGLDFNSVLASNPALAYQVGAVGAPGYGAQQAGPLAARTPRWAQGGGFGAPQPAMGGFPNQAPAGYAQPGYPGFQSGWGGNRGGFGI